MQYISFDAKARIGIPPPKDPTLQSLYIFNMYRAGSSLMEAIAESIAYGSHHTPYNAVQALDAAGVSLIDPEDHSRNAVYLDSTGLSLDKLGTFGGYLYYGFREIPKPYANRFIFTAASVIVARDPRDIAISQYHAVHRHTTFGAAGSDIEILRKQTSQMSLEAFILNEGTIAFLKRFTSCYTALLKRNCKLLKYEDYVKQNGFDVSGLLGAVIKALSPYLTLRLPEDEVMQNLENRIANSKSLKGHATSGRINAYKDLPPSVLTKFNDALKTELLLYNYL